MSERQFEVFILWGKSAESDERPTRYVFNTECERNAFMRGVEEAFRWEDYRIAVDERTLDEVNAEYTCPDCGGYLGDDDNCGTCCDQRWGQEVLEQVSVTAFLTAEEIARARTVWQTAQIDRFKAWVLRELIQPNHSRINRALRGGYRASHLTGVVVAAFLTLDARSRPPEERAPGYLWQWAADTCQECGAYISHSIRWLHVRLCKACRGVTKH